MSDAMATALFRFCGLIAIFGLTVLLAWSGANSVWWLFITLAIIFGLMGLFVLFMCLYAGAEREDPHRPHSNVMMPTDPPKFPPAGGSGTSRSEP